MSVQVLPSLIGLGFSVKRSPIWNTMRQEAASGKETAIAFWSYPRYGWEITYNVLRSDGTNHEFQDLIGFFNARQGMFDSFLYTDSDDNTVSSGTLGVGNGSNLNFQLVRSLGGFVEPVLAPNVVSSVSIDGVAQGSSLYTVNAWGSSLPGVVSLSSGIVPSSSQTVTSSFTYYFPVRFDKDIIDFENFMFQLWACKTLGFTSLK